MRVARTAAAVSIVMAVVAACSGSSDDAGEASGEPDAAAESGSASSINEEATATAEITTTSGEDEGFEGPEPTCSFTGVDEDFGYAQVELSFVNPLGEVVGLEVTYALLDGEGGTRFFTGSAGGLDLVDIMFPQPNEEFRLAVDTREELPPGIEPSTIDCSVLAIEERRDIGGFQRATASDACTVVGEEDGDLLLEVEVASPYEQTTTVQTWWAVRAPGSITFDTDTQVTEFVDPGATFRVTPRFPTDKPEWISEEPVTCAVLGFWDQGQ